MFNKVKCWNGLRKPIYGKIKLRTRFEYFRHVTEILTLNDTNYMTEEALKKFIDLKNDPDPVKETGQSLVKNTIKNALWDLSDWFQLKIWDDDYKEIEIKQSNIPFWLVASSQKSIEFLRNCNNFDPSVFETDLSLIIDYKWRLNYVSIFFPIVSQGILWTLLLINARGWEVPEYDGFVHNISSPYFQYIEVILFYCSLLISVELFDWYVYGTEYFLQTDNMIALISYIFVFRFINNPPVDVNKESETR